ncbi:hypothetical protein C0Q70_21521 [Pomacea canaliculata]|uniref:Uncharacterized protein n=2 Tax=Pomacea canaliculata TaxID=400727 RepID=A0A2T7NCV0_POMCA|nr:hypothetical protein C0Q70_21521 [Pomacea canaliculata]
MFTRQIVQLRLIISRLQNAYNGEDVGWIDTEIEGMSGSGSGDNGGGFGSGSGSGFITEENEKGIVDIDNPPYVAVKPEKPDIKKQASPRERSRKKWQPASTNNWRQAWKCRFTLCLLHAGCMQFGSRDTCAQDTIVLTG